MTDHDLDAAPGLGTALRERLRDERPDLEHLAQSALAAGTRLRRRRRLAAAGGGVLAAVAVAAGASLLSGQATTARDSGVATTPTPSATATVTAAPGDERGRGVGGPVGARLPIASTAPGWACESFPVDEKMWCTKGEAGLTVVVRPAADHAAWTASADKAGSAAWTSRVHGNYFVSVQAGGGPQLRPAELLAFVDGLSFERHWARARP